MCYFHRLKAVLGPMYTLMLAESKPINSKQYVTATSDCYKTLLQANHKRFSLESFTVICSIMPQ